MALACPDCGATLRLRLLTNGRHVCECPTPDPGCRAASKTGRTPDDAADTFVRWAEDHGYIRHLAARVQSLASEWKSSRRPAGISR